MKPLDRDANAEKSDEPAVAGLLDYANPDQVISAIMKGTLDHSLAISLDQLQGHCTPLSQSQGSLSSLGRSQDRCSSLGQSQDHCIVSNKGIFPREDVLAKDDMIGHSRCSKKLVGK